MTTDAATSRDADQAELIAPRVASREYGISPRTLRRAVADGRLTSSRTPGGHHRYRRADLSRLARGEVPG